MPEPITPLPAAKSFAEEEHSVLLGYLTYHRAVLARKVEGLSDEQARLTPCPPSALTLLGLIRHMTDVERWWFRRVLLSEDVPPLFDDEEEWRVSAGAVHLVARGGLPDQASGRLGVVCHRPGGGVAQGGLRRHRVGREPVRSH